MAREYALPSTTTHILDWGLNVSPQPLLKNKRVVIIGTSEDGPLYEPVLIDKPEDAELVWGRQGLGTLVKGIFECWNAQEGSPNVVGVRIGNGTKSVLEILETDSYGINEEQPNNAGAGIESLKLEGRFPGALYNQITINYDDRRRVAVYNPKTQLTSSFSIDINNPNNSSVDAHNVSELADAMNADRNLNSILTASTSGIFTDYELIVRSTTEGVTQNDNGVKLDLKRLIQISGVIADSTNAFMVPSPMIPYGIDETDGAGIAIKNMTITNNLLDIENIESVSNSQYEKIEFSANTGALKFNPLDGKGTSIWDTIQTLYDYNSDSKYMHDPSGNVVSEFIYSLDNVLINELPTDPSGKDGSGIFTLVTPLPLDETEEPNGSGIADAWLMANLATYDSYYEQTLAYSGIRQATCEYIEAISINGSDVRPSGLVKVFVSEDVDPNSNWVELPFDIESGVYISQFVDPTNTNAGYVEFKLGTNCYLANSGGFEGEYINGVKFTNMALLADGDNAIREKRYIRVTGNSVKGFLNETETLPQLEANTGTTPSHYFVRGQEILLNSAPSYPIITNYGTRITYELDSNVALSDRINGEITFTNTSMLPGPGGGSLSSTADSFIRLNYSYLPNFPLITTATQALKNGSNGTKLTVKQREDEFAKAYDYLRDFEARIWVPMEAFTDAIKEDYNDITGLKEQISTSYAADIEDFLDEQSINSTQPHAILGVTPILGDTLKQRDDWVENLTVIDINNPIRGANVMAAIATKFISVAAFEPIFLNLGRGTPYTSNGQAAYAGMIASLPYNVSPTNKAIPGITAVRKTFSIRQLEALNASRYVTTNIRGATPVILNDVTAAPYGSDFISWSIYSITAEAADRVKRVADTYLGQPNSVERRTALDQDISNTLQAMSGLQGFNFTINSTIEQQVLGVLEIDLVIVPVFSIKRIRTTVKLRKSLPISEQ